MNEINEIKIPKGVESISVTQHDDRVVIEFIPEELKKGDLAIFWDNEYGDYPLIRMYDSKDYRGYYDSCGLFWDNAIKFESKEQFEKVLRGEI
jgi:hypothetical protein